MSKRCVLYARVSSNDHLKTGGANLRAQLDLCREYAEGKGYDVVRELAEDARGASGADFDLPRLNEALSLARDGGYDVLVVRELDRLARDMTKQLIVEAELRSAGVIVEYALYDFPDTPEGRLNRNIRATVAEYERAKIAQRMTRGRVRKVRAGEVVAHGRAPFGYRIVERDGVRAFEINEEEAAVVRRVYRLYLEGNSDRGPMGILAISRILTAERVPTWADRRGVDWLKKNGRRGKWGFSSVNRILKVETYAGTWHYGKDKIPVEVPAIVSRETWEAAQRQRGKNYTQAKRNTKHEYLMRSRARCGTCGRAMVGNSRYLDGRLYQYYICDADWDGYDCDHGKYHRSERVDAAVWAKITEWLTDASTLEATLRKYQEEQEEATRPQRQELEAVTGLIADRRQKLERLLDLYLAGTFERDALEERKAKLEAEVAGLEERQQRLEAIIAQGAMSEEQITGIVGYAEAIAEGVELAEGDFDKRRQIVEALDATATLHYNDDTGAEWCELECILGAEALSIVNSSS